MSSLSITPFGERAIEISWPQQIEQTILNDIRHLTTSLAREYSHLLEDIVPTYANLLLVFQRPVNFDKERTNIAQIIAAQKTTGLSSVTRWFLPVCYDPEFGIDLMELSRLKNLSEDKLVGIHSERDYTIHFFGFLPGFFYLGGLDDRLFCPRKANPRTQVKKGSVGIAGSQTGVYPQTSPGGWQLIGRTPVDLFRINDSPPVFAAAGDIIRFYPIDKNEFYEIAAEPNYQIRKEVMR